MNETVFDIVLGLDNNARPYVPGINCQDCGRFIGRDGWIEIETFEMSWIVAGVGGQCARCVARSAET